MPKALYPYRARQSTALTPQCRPNVSFCKRRVLSQKREGFRATTKGYLVLWVIHTMCIWGQCAGFYPILRSKNTEGRSALTFIGLPVLYQAWFGQCCCFSSRYCCTHTSDRLSACLARVIAVASSTYGSLTSRYRRMWATVPA